MYADKNNVLEKQLEISQHQCDEVVQCLSFDFTQIITLLNTTKHSASMMENLINDLMDVAKIENQQFGLDENYFDLAETIS